MKFKNYLLWSTSHLAIERAQTVHFERLARQKLLEFIAANRTPA